jgi:hypothetical protein
MRRRREGLVKLVCGIACACVAMDCAALPAGWQHTQQINVSVPGLVKLSLPIETIDAARPALEDLRLYDDAGNELPFLIERPAPAAKAVQNAKTFQVSLQDAATVITLETGLVQPLDGVTLETPALNFIKAVRVEGSADGRTWQDLTQGRPIFRQSYGASQLYVAFPAAVWPWLRLTIDDHRSQPIPFTGGRLHAAAAEVAPSESGPVTIVERNENPGETRLTLNLGAANLDLATVTIETDEPLFTRAVTLAVPQVAEGSIREQTVGQGVVYRVAIEGQPVSANLSIPLEAQVRSRELVLLIHNEDSPPLRISAVRAERRPIHLLFMARQAGVIRLLTGNKFCVAPRYDLAALGANLKNAVFAPAQISALANNPDFHAPEALPGLEVTGAALDVSGWRFRKAVQLAQAGAKQIDLDLDVLAHADAGFGDLRILRGSNQVPFILVRTSINRSFAPAVTAANDPKNPKLSRWIITLPRAGLPLTRLNCVTKTPLFKRDMSLFEELTDERGEKYRVALGSAEWTQTPERKTKEFSLSFNEAARSDTLFLETENGDNPPIELENFTAFYPVTRVLFKAKADDLLFLYYGNPSIAPPNYDLSLVADELLSADEAPATLAAEEQLKKDSWVENRTPGTGGLVFWAVLGVVVVGLLVIVARLLPKSSPPG